MLAIIASFFIVLLFVLKVEGYLWRRSSVRRSSIAVQCSQINANVEHWSTEDLVAHFKGLGFDKVANAFETKQITGKQFIAFDKMDLVELGIERFSIPAIEKELTRLKKPQPRTIFISFDDQQPARPLVFSKEQHVVEFLRSFGGSALEDVNTNVLYTNYNDIEAGKTYKIVSGPESPVQSVRRGLKQCEGFQQNQAKAFEEKANIAAQRVLESKFATPFSVVTEHQALVARNGEIVGDLDGALRGGSTLVVVESKLHATHDDLAQLKKNMNLIQDIAGILPNVISLVGAQEANILGVLASTSFADFLPSEMSDLEQEGILFLGVNGQDLDIKL